MAYASARVTELLTRGDKIFAEFRPYHIMCDRLAEVFYPERQDFIHQKPPSVDRFEGMFDAEPARLRRDMANMIGAMMRPSGAEWFRVTTGQPDSDELSYWPQRWLDDASRRLRRIVYRGLARFTTAMNQDDHDYVTFGSSVSSCVISQDRQGVLFTNHHLKDVVWLENAEGVIDEVHHRTMLTARKMEQLFGRDVLCKDVAKELEPNGDPNKEFPVRRVVTTFERGGFLSVYLCCTGRNLLAERRMGWMPYHIRRWVQVSGYPWGTSLVTPIALGDSRVLNAAQRTILEAMEKMVDPPLLMKNEGVVGPIRLQAGGVTVGANVDYKSGRPIEVAHELGRPDFGLDYAQRKAEALARLFYENRLALPNQHQMTLGEVEYRYEEFIRGVAPIIQPWTEDNQRLLDKPMTIGLEMGAFETPPDELRGSEIRFEFETPLTKVSDKLRVAQAEKVGFYIGSMQAIDPNAPKTVNWLEMHRSALKGIGPTKWIRDPEEVMAQEAEEQQRAEALQTLQMASEFAKTPVAKVAAERAVNDPSMSGVSGLVGVA